MQQWAKDPQGRRGQALTGRPCFQWIDGSQLLPRLPISPVLQRRPPDSSGSCSQQQAASGHQPGSASAVFWPPFLPWALVSTSQALPRTPGWASPSAPEVDILKGPCARYVSVHPGPTWQKEAQVRESLRQAFFSATGEAVVAQPSPQPPPQGHP